MWLKSIRSSSSSSSSVWFMVHHIMMIRLMLIVVSWLLVVIALRCWHVCSDRIHRITTYKRHWLSLLTFLRKLHALTKCFFKLINLQKFIQINRIITIDFAFNQKNHAQKLQNLTRLTGCCYLSQTKANSKKAVKVYKVRNVKLTLASPYTSISLDSMFSSYAK